MSTDVDFLKVLNDLGNGCVHFHFGRPRGSPWIHIVSKRCLTSWEGTNPLSFWIIRSFPADFDGSTNVVIDYDDDSPLDTFRWFSIDFTGFELVFSKCVLMWEGCPFLP